MSLTNSYAHAETQCDRVHGEAERSSITGRLPSAPKLRVMTERALTEREQTAAAVRLDQCVSDELQDAIDAEHDEAADEHERAIAAYHAEQDAKIEQHPVLQQMLFGQLAALETQLRQIEQLAHQTPEVLTRLSSPDMSVSAGPSDMAASLIDKSQTLTRTLLGMYGIEYMPLRIVGGKGHLQRRRMMNQPDTMYISEPLPGLRAEDVDLPIRSTNAV